jgi:uncharacterized membrane protein YdbT with pleckstrin-like domain
VASEERVLYSTHAAMVRTHPILFALCVLAIALYGLGLLLLLFWWLGCRATTVTVTDKRTILRTGLFSKHTSEVFHKDVRNIQVDQSLGQRVFGVGTISISTAAQSDFEIIVSGIPNPDGVRALVDDHR